MLSETVPHRPQWEPSECASKRACCCLPCGHQMVSGKCVALKMCLSSWVLVQQACLPREQQ